MIRLGSALVAALALAVPATARAQDAPVVGGGSFTDAPIIEPGAYRDTVLPDEHVYYGVRVEPGQRLHVTANTELNARETTDLSLAGVNVLLHAPDRDVVFPTEGDSTFVGSDSDPADVLAPPATTVAGVDGRSVGGWGGPGVYFVSVNAVHVGSEEPRKAEIPFRFTVALEGQAQAEPSPTPTPTPSAAATATAAPPDEGDADDGSPMVAAGAGIGGLLAGVIAGIALRQRRR